MTSLFASTRSSAIAIFAACALLPKSGLAQGPESHSDGPLIAVPHGLSTDPATSALPFDERRVKVKRIGFKDEAMPGGKPGEFPTPVPTPTSPTPPDFSTAAILGLPLASMPDIDALSVGLDWISSDGDGVEVLPDGHWGGLTFSVDRDATGVVGSVIEREGMDVAQGPGGDLFFYIFPDSALPPSIVDETYLAQDAAEMDIDEVGFRPEMDAHDLFVSMVYADNPSKAALLPPPIDVPRVFFSVTDATKGMIPTAWLGGVPEARSGAAVFMTSWTGFSWAPIAPFLLPSDLALSSDEEVDAIAVDLVRCELLFSTKTPSLDQILWVSLCPTAPVSAAAGVGVTLGIPKPYRRPDGTPIRSKAKIGGVDDLDGICALDPGAPFWSELFGRPEQFFPSTSAQPAWASIFVEEDPLSQQLLYRTTFVGWPQPGRQPGAVVCLLQIPGFTPFLDFYANPMRNLGSVFLGAPEEAVIELPLGAPGLSGLEIDLQWAAIDLQTADLAIPLATRIVL